MIRQFMCRQTVIHKQSLWGESAFGRSQGGIFRRPHGFSAKMARHFSGGAVFSRRPRVLSVAIAPPIARQVGRLAVGTASKGT
jgi:hypothetical protein